MHKIKLPTAINKLFGFLHISLAFAFYSFIAIVFSWLLMNVSSSLIHFNNQDRIKRELALEYNYLKSLLDDPDKKEKTTTDGYSNFTSSEWPIMTLSLFCYGARNLALENPSLKVEASQYMRNAIGRAMKPEYYHFIVEHYGDPFKYSEIRDNAFYLGHFVLMLALYREVSGDDLYDDLFHKFCGAFYENYRRSPTFSLESYPGMCWSSEQAPPLRALKVHDDIFGTNYEEVIYKWKETMEERFIDPESKLLVTLFDKRTGEIYQGPRTIANTWTILFLHDVLPEFCRELYINTKRVFLIRRLGFPVFKEYIGIEQYATGDTGPIIWGAAAPSTCFAMGCAGIFGDNEVFLPINVLADSLGLAFTTGNKRRYLLGGQMGTAAVFFCRSMSLLPDVRYGSASINNMVAICFIILIGILLLLWRLWRIVGRFKKLLK